MGCLLHCPLCSGSEVARFHQDQRRSYFRCSTCALVFVPSNFYISAAAEKAEYDLHQNSADDPGYRRFLSRIFKPVQARLRPHSRGLDFGSGPGPTLSVMFEEVGYTVALYDRFYAPTPTVWGEFYDFITASEVVEHLHQPGETLARLWACLKPGGLLAVMTKLVLDQAAFAGWHYKNDLTHICFFSQETFTWLGAQWQVQPEFVAKDVVIFTKPVDLSNN